MDRHLMAIPVGLTNSGSGHRFENSEPGFFFDDERVQGKIKIIGNGFRHQKP